MNTMCAALGCTAQREAGSMFCHRHPTSASRIIRGVPDGWPWEEVEVETLPEPKPVKAVVKWVAETQMYFAQHPGYWTGAGSSPGAALRDMSDIDEFPF